MNGSTKASLWTALIDDMVAGRWINPETGLPGKVPYESVVIAERLDGREAELVAGLGFSGKLAVVCDENTHDIMGKRVASALRSMASVEVIVLDHPHADETQTAVLRERARHADALVAVGSGTVNDLCKYVTAQDGRACCVFGTAPSMNGYTSTTASIMLASGMKVSLPAQAPKGVFIDLAVNAAAPGRLRAAGFGDCLARSVAQFDWWLSHRLFDTYYTNLPFALELTDEAELMTRAAGLAGGDINAVGYLHRVLTLCGFGVSFTGMTNHGSMGEHQISHYIDCFAGPRHPGSLHGEQVGVASLTMARLQQRLLSRDHPPAVRASVIDEPGMRLRYGNQIFELCRAELAAKALNAAAADAMNARLADIWPLLKKELQAFIVPVAAMHKTLAEAGGAVNAADMGLDVPFYREAVCGAREIRKRYSALDLMADAGLLNEFAAGET